MIILVACTKSDNSLTLQDNMDNMSNNTERLIENLVVANETITQLVVANIDQKINKINDISLTMIGNSEFVDIITKSHEEYKAEEIISKEIFMNMYKCDYITNIVYINEGVIDVLNSPKYQEANFLDIFLESEIYKKVIEKRGKPVFTVGLFNDEEIYILRLVTNILEPNKFAVMVIEINPNKLFEDIPFLNNAENIKSALIDNTGQVIFDTGIEHYEDNRNINIDREIVNLKNKNSIIVNAKCINGWIYILEQKIK
jgi:hypothetical protein